MTDAARPNGRRRSSGEPQADLGILEPTLFGMMMVVIVPAGLWALGAGGPRLRGQVTGT